MTVSAARPAASRPTKRRRRSERETRDDLEVELREFLGDAATWPTYAEFRERGKRGLRQRVGRHGGARYWARRLGVRYPRRRPTEKEIRDGLEVELRKFLGDASVWPTYREFQRRGERGLRDRVTQHGGERYWARRLAIPYGRHVPGYEPVWTEERIRTELASFLNRHEAWPTRAEFERAGEKLLRDAVQRTGGPERWAKEFGLSRVSNKSGSRRVWTEERIESELRKFLHGRTEWPPRSEFIAAGQWPLLTAAHTRGGADYWAKRLGVKRPKRRGPPSRRVWTQERIRDELAAFCDGDGRWPRYSEFVAAGKRGLYTAASLRGGIDYWIKELGLSK